MKQNGHPNSANKQNARWAKRAPSDSDPRAAAPLQFSLGMHDVLWGWRAVSVSLFNRLTDTPRVAKHKLRGAAPQLLKCSQQSKGNDK